MWYPRQQEHNQNPPLLPSWHLRKGPPVLRTGHAAAGGFRTQPPHPDTPAATGGDRGEWGGPLSISFSFFQRACHLDVIGHGGKLADKNDQAKKEGIVSTTGRKTAKEMGFGSVEAGPDDPIYRRGWIIGCRNLRSSSKSTAPMQPEKSSTEGEDLDAAGN